MSAHPGSGGSDDDAPPRPGADGVRDAEIPADDVRGSGPGAQPYAPYTPPDDPIYGTPSPLAAALAPAQAPRPSGLSPATARTLTALSPFVALIGFFVLANVGVGPAWLTFLLIPMTAIVTERLKREDGPR